MARKKRWLSWGRTTETRKACLQALRRMGSVKARQTITELSTTGDYFLKRMAKAAAQ